MKRLLKNNHGMTLMEILVALSLLMIVIVGTTPVMLSAYDSLYTAGEYTQDTYEAKSEVEDKLATRNTKDIYNPGFQVNFENIGEVANINARRAVSSLYGSVEALFSNGKVHVAVVSSKTVNDDLPTVASTNASDYYEVIIQTSNLDFGDDVKNKYDAAAKVSINNEAKVEDGDETREKIIDLTFIIPNKQADGEAKIYTYKDDPNTSDVTETGQIANVYEDAEGNNCEVDPVTGRITVRINGFDFTQSPIKIYVSYLDENNKKQVTHTYLFIDQPTIIAAGETGTYDYYTSPGVVTKKVKDANGNVSETTEFGVYGRTMRISGATGTQAIPGATIFKSVNWITETDQSGETVSSSYEPSYYVLTGTNGAIYRTYGFKGTNDVEGKVDFSGITTDAPYNVSQAGQDVIGVIDNEIILNDKSATIIYPSVWGGDFSHVYIYSAYDSKISYKGQDTWQTESGSSGKGMAGYYSNKAGFSYYYNGYDTDFDYSSENSKRISYLLTEIPYALRVGGYLNEAGDYDKSLNRIWERPIIWNADGTFNSPEPTKQTSKGSWGATDFVGLYYKKPGENFTRCTIVDIKKKTYESVVSEVTNWKYDDDYLNEVPTYFDRNENGESNQWGDDTFAQLRLKGLTTVSPTFLYDMKDYNKDGRSNYLFGFNGTTNKSQISVTDAVYLPATSKTSAGVFYVGTVAAYGVINQLDNVDTNENYAAEIRAPHDSGDRTNRGGITTYYVMGNNDSTGTTIYKYSSPDKGRDESDTPDNNLTVFSNKSSLTGTGVSATSDESKSFFVTRSAGSSTSKLFNDVYFTMGFTSNREMVYTNIVYGETSSGVTTESFKSYEGYYFLSHWDDVSANHYPTLAINDLASKSGETAGSSNGNTSNPTAQYRNSMDNDFYNVWFPGEMYNLTKVATEDGVTASVGYAVSGSTYTWLNPSQSTNGSTALGNIHNDGVLSAMIMGVDASFTNLLYFKEQDSNGFDNDYLTNTYGAHYDSLKDSSGNYGTHSRDSVQFTAVDIGVQRVVSGTTEKATYYAYYADNKGRVFRSKVAVKSSSVPNDYNPEDENANANVTVNSLKKVNYISDVIVQPGDTRLASDTVGYMEQLSCHPTINFEWLYSKITSIKVEGKYLIVAGHPNPTYADTIDTFGIPIVVGLIDETTGNITKWSIACLAANEYSHYCNVEDLLVKDGRVYAAGTFELPNDPNPGFIAVLNLSDVQKNLDKIPANDISKTEAPVFPLVFQQLPDKLYAIAGQ